ncbi:DUF427 domain-containing protein [Actinoplanes xinjiangensis]|uniref:Uncharacterized protein (DUF427 family) n=1 Tax=Actinoplanes xinjiangensis TaxID=512350 RepID=A0A316EJ13_9ACTN|nr:DUF427 domain-containing protein [Actinoplanes xinjiangensis]PWK31047.1 uncharacterized protein (DUF427 family) [Actinoplanes xinjiangensis]GIF44183.1 hypothetical protein Axi01nite_84940 [Actinoplanes xinjiangensis]
MESVWDYPRPPRLERAAARVTVVHAGLVVVDSEHCWRALETSHPPVYYVPRDDIADGVLEAAAGESYCEFKGIAGYWDLVVGEARVQRAGWSYERPSPAYAAIAGAVAFYPSRVDECRVGGEPVRPQEGDFYGGWITADITGPFKGGPGTRGW